MNHERSRKLPPGAPVVDLLLIQPPVCDFYLTAGRTLPYGLAMIAAQVRTAGYRVEILDALATRRSRVVDRPGAMAYLEPFFGQPDVSATALFHAYRRFGYSHQHLSKQIKALAPRVVGISSLFTAYSDSALAMADLVKAIAPEATVVLGGHHPTALPESVMAHPTVDYVIRGDGEAAMPALMDALIGGGDLATVPGLVCRDSDGGVASGPAAVMANLDTVPLPDMTAMTAPAYRRHGHPAMAITTSRGCPLSCSYCCQGRDGHTPFRRRSLDSVLAEIDHGVMAHGARFIDFEDEHITWDREWFLALMAEITRQYSDLSLELRAMNGLFPPTITDSVLVAMKAAGFTEVNLALGTAVPAQSRRFHRPDVAEDFDRAVHAARGLGLRSVGYIIVGAPHQSADDSLSDLIHLARLPVLGGVSVFYPAPGSPDFDRCARQGLLPADLRLMRSAALPVDHTTSRLAAVTLLRLGRLVNFIKSLQNQGGPPVPASVPDRLDPTDRKSATLALVAGFFYDGGIRGVTPTGEVYAHRVDAQICESFRRQVAPSDIQGVGPV